MGLFGGGRDEDDQDNEPLLPPPQELGLSEDQWRFMMLRRMMHAERRDRRIERKLNTIITMLSVGKAGVVLMRWIVTLGAGFAAWWGFFHGK